MCTKLTSPWPTNLLHAKFCLNLTLYLPWQIHQRVKTVLGSLQLLGANSRTLEVSLVLNAGTIYQRTSLLDFPIFAPLHIFLGYFFLQNWNLQPWFSLSDPILGIYSIERGSLKLEGSTPIKIGAKFFQYEVSHIKNKGNI
jgi:hypothetical protein